MIKKIEVAVLEDNDIDGNLNNFIKKLLKIINSVPAEFKDHVMVETESYYDSYYATLNITYKRPETEEEERNKTLAEKEREEGVIEKEKETLRLLKLKYEGEDND